MCGGGGGLFSFLVATDRASGQAKANKAKTEARDARNAFEGEKSNLARFQQSLGNKKLLDEAGRTYNTVSENIGRRMDQQVYEGVMGKIALSEELGAASAAAAAAGMGGSSVEQYNQTIQTSYAFQKELQDRANDSENYYSFQTRGQVMSSGIDALNRDVIIANQDRTYYGPTKGPSLLGNLATLAVSAAASVAGAPQLGEAILKARTSKMQADYGDASGASKSFGGALDSFKLGVGEVRSIFRSRPR